MRHMSVPEGWIVGTLCTWSATWRISPFEGVFLGFAKSCEWEGCEESPNVSGQIVPNCWISRTESSGGDGLACKTELKGLQSYLASGSELSSGVITLNKGGEICGLTSLYSLKAKVATLKVMRSRTGSQWGFMSAEVTWSYFWVPVTTRANKFWMRCSLTRLAADVPYRRDGVVRISPTLTQLSFSPLLGLRSGTIYHWLFENPASA
jgi:hypothetical protein